MPRIVRLIPERTVDSWFAASVIDAFPDVMLWAPTPPAQSAKGDQPWDFVVGDLGASHKLLIVETKALLGFEESPYKPRVTIDLEQLERLAALAAIDDVPAFYGLPALQSGELPVPLRRQDPLLNARMRLIPPLNEWMRMLRTSELLAIPRVHAAVLRHQSTVSVSTSELSGHTTLSALINSVKACQVGRRFGPSDEGTRVFRQIPSDSAAQSMVHSALIGTHDPELIEEGLRSHLIESPSVISTEDSEGSTSPPWKRNHLGRTLWLWVPIE